VLTEEDIFAIKIKTDFSCVLLAAGLRPLQPVVTITSKSHLGHSLCWEKDCL